jgi:hypothetical protein
MTSPAATRESLRRLAGEVYEGCNHEYLRRLAGEVYEGCNHEFLLRLARRSIQGCNHEFLLRLARREMSFSIAVSSKKNVPHLRDILAMKISYLKRSLFFCFRLYILHIFIQPGTLLIKHVQQIFFTTVTMAFIRQVNKSHCSSMTFDRSK